MLEIITSLLARINYRNWVYKLQELSIQVTGTGHTACSEWRSTSEYTITSLVKKIRVTKRLWPFESRTQFPLLLPNLLHSRDYMSSGYTCDAYEYFSLRGHMSHPPFPLPYLGGEELSTSERSLRPLATESEVLPLTYPAPYR